MIMSHYHIIQVISSFTYIIKDFKVAREVMEEFNLQAEQKFNSTNIIIIVVAFSTLQFVSSFIITKVAIVTSDIHIVKPSDLLMIFYFMMIIIIFLNLTTISNFILASTCSFDFLPSFFSTLSNFNSLGLQAQALFTVTLQKIIAHLNFKQVAMII